MNEYDPFLALIRRLATGAVRYVMIGVWAANYYARHGAQVFATEDRDLFISPAPENLVNGWNASRDSDFELWSGDEPLGEPLDRWLAERVISRRATTRAIHPDGIAVDFTLEMKGFDFETVWNARRIFRVGDVDVPVARLSQIVESKAKVNRPKDRLFLATWEEILRDSAQDEK